MRGKKIIARNILGNSLNSAVSNPFQDLSFKLTSLSANAASSANHEFETSPSVSFKFMASNEEGLGAINDWEGDWHSLGDRRRAQNKDQTHGMED